jgi:SAM-dependent methyltransferase
MGVQERLSLEAVSANTLIACEHVHRYRLAASLCQGLRVLDLGCGSGYGSAILRESAVAVTGVDNDVATVDMARVTVGAEHDVLFEAADAAEYLQRDLGESFDAIVCFESLEHLPDPEDALASLENHAREGLRLVLSVPNSRTLGEVNEFHVTDYGFDEAQEAFARFEEVTILYQFNAEGSLIRQEEPAETDGEFVLDEHGEPEYANHFIACVNLTDRLRETAGLARLQLTVAPDFTRHMLALERANQELWRTNARLARQHLGVSDSAAAAVQDRMRAIQQEAAQVKERLQAELDHANRRLLILDTPRHQALERLRERLVQHRVLSAIVRRLWALVHG